MPQRMKRHMSDSGRATRNSPRLPNRVRTVLVAPAEHETFRETVPRERAQGRNGARREVRYVRPAILRSLNEGPTVCEIDIAPTQPLQCAEAEARRESKSNQRRELLPVGHRRARDDLLDFIGREIEKAAL